ncbi:type IV pilin-like G/H family protein [Phormidium sp. CCY1219]|uniref:type IV pilin-like G/H family protein n=1 Tax=Phormidium sp. CCY1219 TaxID=2886104 RepID=UPI002D1E581A|nr:type IV pilin-like G/H family protein [Phormidium sp. CCY1219]MEB3826229.1 hypothetical protein [Phormidium sp. CCY1219]
MMSEEKGKKKWAIGFYKVLLLLAVMIPLQGLIMYRIFVELEKSRLISMSLACQKTVKKINTAQKVYFSKYQRFANSVEALQISFTKNSKPFHRYGIKMSHTAVLNYGIYRQPPPDEITEKLLEWYPTNLKKPPRQNYLGIVVALPNSEVNPDATKPEEMLPVSVLCESPSADAVLAALSAEPIVQNGNIECPEGMKNLGQ